MSGHGHRAIPTFKIHSDESVSASSDPRKAKLQQWKVDKEQRMAELRAKQCMNASQQPTMVVGTPTRAAAPTGFTLMNSAQKKNPLRARPSNWNASNQGNTTPQQMTKKTKIHLVVVPDDELTTADHHRDSPGHDDEDDDEENAEPGLHDVSLLVKNLGTDFSNADNTCNLSSLLADLAVATKQEQTVPSAMEGTTSGADEEGPETVITAVAKPSAALEGVAELDSPACEPGSPFYNAAVAKGVAYFRNQTIEQTHELSSCCERWNTAVQCGGVPEDAVGDINAVVGQAQLLMRKRFTQFGGLCDMNEANGCLQPGQTARDADLDGFWDVIMMQVDDIKRSFEALEGRAALQWKEEEAKDCRAPKKRKRVDDPVLQRLRKQPKPGPTTPRRQAAKNRLKAAKRAHRSNGTSRLASGGGGASVPAASVAVLTPMRASKKDQQLLGTQFLLTPVRRSTRQTPSKFKSDVVDDSDIQALLVQGEYSYKPNAALAGAAVEELSSICSPPNGFDAIEEGEEPSPETKEVAMHLGFGDCSDDPVKSLSVARTPQSRVRRPSAAARGMATPVSSRSGGSVNVTAPSPLGGVVRFAAVTPGKGMKEQLGTDVIYTPVRRSSRLVASTSKQHTVNKTSELPVDLDFGYAPNKFM
jgi:hypothetical protein